MRSDHDREHEVTIGVDRLFQARGRWWCHMLCDDFSETGLARLHEFATEIGLSRRAFHDPPGHPRPHYDLTPPFREVALRNGAVLLESNRDVVEFLRKGREKLR